MSNLPFALIASLGLVVIVLALGYITATIKAPEFLEFSFRTFLLSYFYRMTVTSLLARSLGVANLLQVGMGATLGKKFDYSAPLILCEPDRLPAPSKHEDLLKYRTAEG